MPRNNRAHQMVVPSDRGGRGPRHRAPRVQNPRRRRRAPEAAVGAAGPAAAPPPPARPSQAAMLHPRRGPPPAPRSLPANGSPVGLPRREPLHAHLHVLVAANPAIKSHPQGKGAEVAPRRSGYAIRSQGRWEVARLPFLPRLAPQPAPLQPT